MIRSADPAVAPTVHPLEDLVRMDRIPHIWCPGCGTGSVFTACLTAIKQTGIPYDQFAMVSGIGCSGRGAGYINIDSFHTTHGRAIPFATGIKMANPKLNVIVFSGDGDLFAIGGNHFIHAARRNMDITVVCVNNLTYGMTGGQVAATTPHNARSSTTVMGNPETPFNLPLLAYAAGATYIARWSMLHARDLADAIAAALRRRGFSFIEALSPCPVNYGRRNREKAIDTLRHYQEKAIIKNGAHPAELDMSDARGPILGNFLDIEKPTHDEIYKRMYRPEEG
ncbi:thiamine pyrophosphate-dependent enzyme [Desulfococcus multivorans]|jgi:2-oxoglutarate ferredoxin oxidoreductase subunit beta|uniref:Thiamine pyrophosphate TPP-binding domain-containing protein n=1 Tax=Desulfococcus multivorans DSM 2059 TaxID=1121405 RepID=S7V2R1_DESML|nr:thiamine pyrophosphate-dependent enzyme [Desulfococcus multivorans]AOY57057.1 KorB2: 2-oxoglutarate synthase, subunit beta [Desulfococcus multivorans]AQU99571.1 2-oxoacid:ferredoxin oxidoreductase subunit beta [Desulfococcus multivorans]EPR40744.1 thiamine pyrophosphate TPP-binding domain-containing protein [Desulfococcus multivorans DSM 2059]SJZ88529.1 2-oxoglutarate ferredoxin oxidoreductase, beta subunit [Desulfococcus multivorans DSM 2059]